MGSSFSLNSCPKLKAIRVVHLNGNVQDFDYPVLASQITGKSSKKFFVSTPAHLLSAGLKSLSPDVELQQGQIYFVLPYSILQAEVSPLDFTSLAKRLNSIAKSYDHRKCSQTVLVSNFPNKLRSDEIPRYDAKRCVSGQPWKPILDTIREKSFHQRSESDVILHEYCN